MQHACCHSVIRQYAALPCERFLADDKLKARWIKAFRNLQVILAAPIVVSDSHILLKVERQDAIDFRVSWDMPDVRMDIHIFSDNEAVNSTYCLSGVKDYHIYLLYICQDDFAVSKFLNEAVQEKVLIQAKSDAYTSHLHSAGQLSANKTC